MCKIAPRFCNTVLPAYCETGSCDKTLIVIVLAIPIPEWHFYTKKFADSVTIFVNVLIIVTIMAKIMRKIW